MRSLYVVLSVTLLLTACGSRSAYFPLGSGDKPADGGGNPSQEGGLARDAALLRDAARLDSCLPVPSEKVQGRYQGQWEGVVECFDATPVDKIKGQMFFSLEPSGRPESFNVRGSMKGQMLKVFTFSATIEGTMSCTSLEAKLPDIVVQGSGMMTTLAGHLSGVFTSQGFEGGSWEAKGVDSDFPCVASGTWRADNE